MNIKNFLNIVSEEIKYKPVRKNIVNELALHLEESKEFFVLDGMTNSVAEEKATLQMGDPKVIGKKLNKIHRNKIDWKLILIAVVLISLNFLNATNKGFGIELNNDISITQTVEAYIISIILGIFISCVLYRINYQKIYKCSLLLYIMATILSIIHCDFWGIFDGTIFNNLAIFSTPMYIIAFVGLIENNNSKSKINLILLTVISIIVLAIKNIEYALLVAIVYLIISIIKLSQQKENKYKFLIAILLLCVTLFITFLSLKLNIKIIYKEKDIINNAKLIGKIDTIDPRESYFIKNTNYIFISLLANNGWLISCGMFALIILLNIKLIINSTKIKDLYGKFLIIGIASMFIARTVLNLVINIIFGIPSEFTVPLVSYGKLNLIIDMSCLSITLSIYRKKNIILYTNEKEEKNKLVIA